MTKIGCRVVQNMPCWLCSGCANHKACIHLEYYNKKRGIKSSGYKPRKFRKGGKRDCNPGMTDLGLTCTGCHTWCNSSSRDALGNCWAWDLKTQCETYGKYDDEFNHAFEEVGNFFKNLPNVLKDAFSPNGPLAHLFDPNLNGIAQAIAKSNAAMKDAFDPEKNGVAASFRKFKSDLEGAFNDIGDKLNKAFDPENIKRSFGPLVDAFNAFGDSVSHYFSDPSNIVSFLCICMTSLGSLLPPPISNALGALAAVTQMIGDAALGKPFDPANLLDLAQAFVVPPAARLAGKIATTTSKAATVLGRVKAGATAVQKAVVKDAKTAISNIAKMSAKDKAILVGKTVFKIGGKVAGSQGPVSTQESPEQRHHDDVVEEDWGAQQNDPEAKARADELNDQINEDYEQQAEELQKDVVGMPVKQAEMDKIANATSIRTNAVTSQSVDEWLADAESNPKKYAKDEKAWLYKTKKMDEIQAMRDQKVALSLEQSQKKLLADNELAVKRGEKTAEQGRQYAEKLKFKAENEKRKYGLSYSDAIAKIALTDMELKLEALGPKYCPMTQKDQEDPQGWAERNPTCQYGVVFSEGGDNDYTVENTGYTGGRRRKGGAVYEPPTPATLQAENIKVDRGENAPGNDQHLYIFPAIEFPTFNQFVIKQAKAGVYPIKVRKYLNMPSAFPDKPNLTNPDDWFKTYSTYTKLVHKMMDDYKNLMDANTAAITARNTPANVERALATINPPPPPTPEEVQQTLDSRIDDFRSSHGNNTPEQWNTLIDTFYEMNPDSPPGEANYEWQVFSSGLPEPVKVDVGQFAGGRKGKKVCMPLKEYKAEHKHLIKLLSDAGKEGKKQLAEVRQRGGVIVRPDEKDAGKYYMDLMKKENPKSTPTIERAQIRFEQDYNADPASTTANIKAYMAQFPTPITGGIREDELQTYRKVQALDRSLMDEQSSPYVEGSSPVVSALNDTPSNLFLRRVKKYMSVIKGFKTLTEDDKKIIGPQIHAVDKAIDDYEKEPTEKNQTTVFSFMSGLARRIDRLGTQKIPLSLPPQYPVKSYLPPRNIKGPGKSRRRKGGMEGVAAAAMRELQIENDGCVKATYEFLRQYYPELPPFTGPLPSNLNRIVELARQAGYRTRYVEGIETPAEVNAEGVRQYTLAQNRKCEEIMNDIVATRQISVIKVPEVVFPDGSRMDAHVMAFLPIARGHPRYVIMDIKSCDVDPLPLAGYVGTAALIEWNGVIAGLAPFAVALPELFLNFDPPIEVAPAVASSSRPGVSFPFGPPAAGAPPAGRGRRRRKGGEDPPAEDPPTEDPPTEDPPTEDPPADTPAEADSAVLDYLEKNKQKVNDAVTQKTLTDFGHTLYTDWLPNALQDYLQAEASEKRTKRAKVLAYIDYANIQYDPMPDALKEDASTWNKQVLDQAPELIDMGDELQPKESWASTDEGKAELEQLNKTEETIQASVAATEAEKQLATETAGQTETERKNYDQWKSEFDTAFKNATTEEERTQAIQVFNDHFPADDPRRLSGSGRHAPTLVMGNLWIGNHRDAVNEKWLKKHKIHAVFNITPSEPFAKLPIKKYRFDIDDDPQETGRMTKMGPEVAEKIMEAIAEGPVLIHCVEGRQRSATIAALCMAIQRGGKHKTVMKRLQHKRPLCFTPKATFEISLKKWLG